MAKQYANIQPGFDTFSAWLTKTNNLLDDMTNIVVTVASNSTGGVTTGNAYITGTFSGTTGAFNTIRGGNVSTNATLTIASNVAVSNGYALSFGNSTVNTTVNATSFSGMANSANALTTTRNIALTTDVSGNGNFNGTANLTIAVTLANSGVTANTYGNSTVYPIITVDAKGRVTSVTAQTISTPASGVTTFNTRSGDILLTAADITGNSTIGLNYTPISANTSGTITGSLTLTSGDLTVRDVLSSRDIRAGNTTVNAVINAISITIGNSTVTGVLNSTALAVKGIVANGSLGTNGQQLVSNGTGMYWSTVGGGATLTANSTDTQTFYIPMANTTSGSWSNGVVSTTKLYFVPSTGTLNSTIFNSLSDAAAKDNVEPIADAVDVVNQLTGVTFNWKNTGDKSSGVIAQDLEKIIPFLVTDTDGTKSVNYSGLIAYLIQAVKELSAKVDRLENN